MCWTCFAPRTCRVQLPVLGLQKTLNLVTIAGAYMMLLAALTMAFAKAERVARLECSEP